MSYFSGQWIRPEETTHAILPGLILQTSEIEERRKEWRKPRTSSPAFRGSWGSGRDDANGATERLNRFLTTARGRTTHLATTHIRTTPSDSPR